MCFVLPNILEVLSSSFEMLLKSKEHTQDNQFEVITVVMVHVYNQLCIQTMVNGLYYVWQRLNIC